MSPLAQSAFLLLQVSNLDSKTQLATKVLKTNHFFDPYFLLGCLDYSLGALGRLQYGTSLEVKLIRVFPDDTGCSLEGAKEEKTTTHANYGETATVLQNGGCLLSKKVENAALLGVNVIFVVSDSQEVVPFGKSYKAGSLFF